MSAHLCHAENCKHPVPRQMFMCRKHWYMVPMDLRGRLLGEYRQGQENLDPWPSNEYVAVAMQCIEAVTKKESARA